MMDDLISRKALLAEIEHKEKENNHKTDCAFREGYACGLDYALERTNAALSVDAEPVRHAIWETVRAAKGHTMTFCSMCHSQGILESKYCPDCGARMDLPAPEATP